MRARRWTWNCVATPCVPPTPLPTGHLPRIAPRAWVPAWWAIRPWGARLMPTTPRPSAMARQDSCRWMPIPWFLASVNYRQSLEQQVAPVVRPAGQRNDALAHSATSILTQTAPARRRCRAQFEGGGAGPVLGGVCAAWPGRRCVPTMRYWFCRSSHFYGSAYRSLKTMICCATPVRRSRWRLAYGHVRRQRFAGA